MFGLRWKINPCLQNSTHQPERFRNSRFQQSWEPQLGELWWTTQEDSSGLPSKRLIPSGVLTWQLTSLQGTSSRLQTLFRSGSLSILKAMFGLPNFL